MTERAGVDPADIDDVVGGCVDQVAERAFSTTRWAVLAAGFPEASRPARSAGSAAPRKVRRRSAR